MTDFRDLDDVRNFLDSSFGIDKSDEIMATVYKEIDKRVEERADEIENEWEDRVCEAEDARDEAETLAADYSDQIDSLEAEVSDLQEEVEKLKSINSEIPF